MGHWVDIFRAIIIHLIFSIYIVCYYTSKAATEALLTKKKDLIIRINQANERIN